MTGWRLNPIFGAEGAIWSGSCKQDKDNDREARVTLGHDLQDGEFSGLEREDWEEEETDHEAYGCTQVTGTEDEHAIPTTH